MGYPREGTFGFALRAAREHAGLSVEDAARRVTARGPDRFSRETLRLLTREWQSFERNELSPARRDGTFRMDLEEVGRVLRVDPDVLCVAAKTAPFDVLSAARYPPNWRLFRGAGALAEASRRLLRAVDGLPPSEPLPADVVAALRSATEAVTRPPARRPTPVRIVDVGPDGLYAVLPYWGDHTILISKRVCEPVFAAAQTATLPWQAFAHANLTADAVEDLQLGDWEIVT